LDERRDVTGIAIAAISQVIGKPINQRLNAGLSFPPSWTGESIFT
jgi:hypothetical protein